MFTRPIFETLGIAIVALGILLMALAYSPFALLAGIVVLGAGLVVIYRHYIDMGTDASAFD